MKKKKHSHFNTLYAHWTNEYFYEVQNLRSKKIMRNSFVSLIAHFKDIYEAIENNEEFLIVKIYKPDD